MLALRFRFPARRFHATPWGRHVNEAEVAWPPGFWRLCRALIATWHRKLAPGSRKNEGLSRLLAALAAAPPVYRLPPAVHAHARHYMPIRDGKSETRTLVFDAFARVDPDEPLVMAWPALDLDAENAALLDALLAATGYLGRAESWLDADRSDAWDGEPNCFPATEAQAAARDGQEPVDLLLPRTPEDYRSFRSHFLEGLSARGQKPDRRTAATLPEDWFAALSVETSDLHAAGWSQPPAARPIRYLRPADCLKPAVLPRPRPRRQQVPVTTARFALYRKAAAGGRAGGRAPLPRVEDSVRVGEWFRRAVMSRAKRVFGEDAIPNVFSGHAGPAGHRHAFYLPEDREPDGRIDHLILHAPAGLDAPSRAALGGLDRLWNRDGQEWQLILEAVGTASELAAASRLLAESGAWESVTAYLHPWHIKKGFTIEDQIRRECRERGLPEPAIEPVPSIQVAGRDRRPVHFHRFRSKRGLTQPDTRGSFWRVHFPEPIRGPLALGFGCHFGLGLFAPPRQSS